MMQEFYQIQTQHQLKVDWTYMQKITVMQEMSTRHVCTHSLVQGFRKQLYQVLAMHIIGKMVLKQKRITPVTNENRGNWCQNAPIAIPVLPVFD